MEKSKGTAVHGMPLQPEVCCRFAVNLALDNQVKEFSNRWNLQD